MESRFNFLIDFLLQVLEDRELAYHPALLGKIIRDKQRMQQSLEAWERGSERDFDANEDESVKEKAIQISKKKTANNDHKTRTKTKLKTSKSSDQGSVADDTASVVTSTAGSVASTARSADEVVGRKIEQRDRSQVISPRTRVARYRDEDRESNVSSVRSRRSSRSSASGKSQGGSGKSPRFRKIVEGSEASSECSMCKYEKIYNPDKYSDRS